MGPTAENVAKNLRQLRGSISLRTLSARLEDVGHPLSASALQRIEGGDRRVDVDDLSALSVVLGVSPIGLLKVPDYEESGQLTGVESTDAADQSGWLQGITHLPEQQQMLRDIAHQIDEGALRLWTASATGGKGAYPNISDELLARMVFLSRQGIQGSVGYLITRMTADEGDVYVCDADGQVLFKAPDDAPDPYWAPDVEADEDPEQWRGHVVREVKRLIESVEDLRDVVKRGEGNGVD